MDKHFQKVYDRLMAKRKVDPKKGCWLWTGTLDRGGYGQFYYNGKVSRVHRVAGALFLGADLSKGREQCILHRCDVRNCFNPGHLYIGTYKDNNRDCVKKRRHVSGTTINAKRGIDHKNSRLTEQDVREIRRRHANGETTRQLAKEFGVSSPTISSIVRRKTWSHIL